MVLEDYQHREMVPGLRREWMALARRRWLIASTTALSVIGAAIYSYGVRPVYESVATLSITETMANQPALRSLQNPLRLAGTLDREAARITGRDFALRVIERLPPVARAELGRGPLGPWYKRLVILPLAESDASSPANKAAAVGALRSRLVVQSKEQSSWLEVRVTTLDPAAAALLANALVTAYVEEAEAVNRQSIEQSKTALDEQLEQKQEQLGEELDTLRETGTGKGTGNIAARKANLERQIRAFQEALTASQTSLVGRAATAKAAATTGVVEATDPRIQAAQDRVAELEERQRGLLANLGEQHPDVIAVREQLAAARERVQTVTSRVEAAARSAYELARNEQRRIEASLAQAQAELTALEKDTFDFTMTQKKADVKRIAVEQMMQRQENAVPIILATEIVQPAAPPNAPSSPRKRENLTYGLLGGLLAGVLLTWALDRFDDSIQSPEDIKDLLGLPFLGVVPLVPGLNPKIGTALSEVTTGFADGLRVVRTNLMYGAADSRRKVLVFTSASPADGKSTVASGVAHLLRETQARVLLIDGDLRRPSLHLLTDLPESPGLSNLLADPPDVTLQVTSTGAEGFDVLTSGPPLITSAARLGSDNMRSLVEQARRLYDWVIIDSPPSLNLPDAAVLGTLADGVVVVCAGDRTPRQAIRSVTDQMRAVGAPVVGIVLNRVDMNRHSYYYGRHYSTYYGGERGAPAKGGSKGRKA